MPGRKEAFLGTTSVGCTRGVAPRERIDGKGVGVVSKHPPAHVWSEGGVLSCRDTHRVAFEARAGAAMA
jgi:hypothetical protein